MNQLSARRQLRTACRRNSGFTGLIFVLAILGILASMFITTFATSDRKISRASATSLALAKAREALIAYAITHDDILRPGEFPCPTTVLPSAAAYGDSDATCAARRIGRLPWRTLGIPELLDSDGEPLWYAVSNKFRRSSPKINSDTTGDLIIYNPGGASVMANEVVAVVFAAGAPRPGQNRNTNTATCATTGTVIANSTCAANYLENGSGRNNATNSGPYIGDRESATYNDQLAYIKTADFIPAIEEKIVVLLKRALNDYYTVNGYYPYASNYADYLTTAGLNCVAGKFAGRLPLNIGLSPQGANPPCTGLADWQPVGNPNGLPAWFTSEEWSSAIHYAIGKAFAKGGNKTCGGAGACLTVGVDASIQAVFILPGVASPAQSRPSGLASNYLENPANSEDWPTPVNFTYVPDLTVSASRDRLVALKNP